MTSPSAKNGSVRCLGHASKPSIVNILAADCGHAADGMTQFDLAYLQGLYKMSAGRRLMMQQNEIADAMADKHLNITARQ